MAVTLDLKPDLEASLLVKARASGMVLEEYLLSVVDKAVSPHHDEPDSTVEEGRADAVLRMIAFGDRHRLSLGEPADRASLHDGHRF